MQKSLHQHPYQFVIGCALLTFAVPLLWWASDFAHLSPIGSAQFLFWYGIVEVLSVVVAMLVFVSGFRAVLAARKGAVVLLGVSFLGVALIDTLHTMSYVGMPEALSTNSTQKSMFFWLVARMLAAAALLTYVVLPKTSEVTEANRRLAVALMLVLVALVGYVGLSWPDRVPALVIAERNLTPLTVGLEWMITVTNVGSLVVLWRRRQALVRECVMALFFATALSAVSELFTVSAGLGRLNELVVVGSLYKLAAYLYLFHATFNESMRRPLQRMATQHLREKATLNCSPNGVLWVDETGCILMTNPALEELTGYSKHELVGQRVDIFLPEHLRDRHAELMRRYFHAPHTQAMGTLELQLLRRDGEMLPVEISLGSWEDDGAYHAIAYILDLTERKKFEESLRHQATHDELTGLPNRWLFRLQLSQALARATRGSSRVAVLFLDLDHFKTVNDSFGHATGDALLVQVSDRIGGALRANDTLARLGGDEFAILLTELTGVDEAICVATKLLESLQRSNRLQDQDVYSSGSLGISFYPDDAKDSESLLRYADLAMYQAKQSGRGAYACYSHEMDQRVHEDIQLHSHLKEALVRGSLQLHYQPQIDVESGEIVGAEALLRWRDSVLGDVSPARFIPVAEATGLILPISDWVLETACNQIAKWALAGTPLRVAINVSVQQFRQRDLPQKVCAALARTGASAHWLDIEITESVAMTRPDQACEQIQALVELGCRVALDDFGTGYSSLAYLRALPVAKLKIDKSFMDGIHNDSGDATICCAIIALAHSLGMTLVAEGVETETQLAFLLQSNCEIYQGWLFSKAMDAADLTSLLMQRRLSGSDSLGSDRVKSEIALSEGHLERGKDIRQHRFTGKDEAIIGT